MVSVAAGKEDFMRDYTGDMKYYQDQLAAKGITKEMLDMDNYAGLTARELQSIVDSVQLKSKESA